jgi:hypothetical protein
MTATTQARAKKGGEIGANGEFYEGGKFIAKTEKPKSQAEIRKATRRQNTSPYVWEVAPNAELVAIFPSLNGIEFFNHNTKTFAFNADLRGSFATEEAIECRKNKIEAYNNGKKWHKPFTNEIY